MRRLIRVAMVLIAVGLSLVAYSGLPERVPLHWNFSGEVDRYGSRYEALFMMPLLMIGIWALLRFLPRIDPLRGNYARFAGTYEVMFDAILAMMLVIHVAILLAASGAQASGLVLVNVAAGAACIVLGNVMPRTRQNWFFGVRTPWTLANARVWEKTHRLAGYLFVALGILVIANSAVAPRVGYAVLIGGSIAVALVATAYSYLEWRKEKAATT